MKKESLIMKCMITQYDMHVAIHISTYVHILQCLSKKHTLEKFLYFKTIFSFKYFTTHMPHPHSNLSTLCCY